MRDWNGRKLVEVRKKEGERAKEGGGERVVVGGHWSQALGWVAGSSSLAGSWAPGQARRGPQRGPRYLNLPPCQAQTCSAGGSLWVPSARAGKQDWIFGGSSDSDSASGVGTSLAKLHRWREPTVRSRSPDRAPDPQIESWARRLQVRSSAVGAPTLTSTPRTSPHSMQ